MSACSTVPLIDARSPTRGAPCGHAVICFSCPRHNAAMDILARARTLGPELVDLRHALHRVPELDRDLPKTQALVLDALAGLDLEVVEGKALSSVTAVLRGRGHDGSGPVVLLRGDMDALPVLEQTGLPFSSEHEGTMHACGHNLHVASLVG